MCWVLNTYVLWLATVAWLKAIDVGNFWEARSFRPIGVKSGRRCLSSLYKNLLYYLFQLSLISIQVEGCQPIVGLFVYTWIKVPITRLTVWPTIHARRRNTCPHGIIVCSSGITMIILLQRGEYKKLKWYHARSLSINIMQFHNLLRFIMKWMTQTRLIPLVLLSAPNGNSILLSVVSSAHVRRPTRRQSYSTARPQAHTSISVDCCTLSYIIMQPILCRNRDGWQSRLITSSGTTGSTGCQDASAREVGWIWSIIRPKSLQYLCYPQHKIYIMLYVYHHIYINFAWHSEIRAPVIFQ